MMKLHPTVQVLLAVGVAHPHRSVDGLLACVRWRFGPGCCPGISSSFGIAAATDWRSSSGTVEARPL